MARGAELIGLAPGQRVLDVGTGAGALVRFAADAMAGSGEIVALDHDADLLEKARESIAASEHDRERTRAAAHVRIEGMRPNTETVFA